MLRNCGSGEECREKMIDEGGKMKEILKVLGEVWACFSS